MNNIDFFIFLLKSTLCFSLLYLCYRLIFSKTTFFQLNRLYLISIVPLSLILPFIKIGQDSNIQNTFYTILPEITIKNASSIESTAGWINWQLIFWLISALFFIHYLIKVISLGIRIHQLKKGHAANISPFSFFNYIHIPKNINDENKDLIVAHEKVHANQIHSLDILIYEIYKVMFWFNPLVWKAVKDVKSNHEFIADNIAAKENINNYSKVLVAQLLGVNCSDLVNNFNTQPLIKKRIKMMKTQKTNKLLALSYSLIAPMIVVAILGAGSIRVNAQTSNAKKAVAADKKVYEKVDQIDQMPEFREGTEALIAYLGKEITYPKKAEKENLEGTVFVSFVINEKGEVTKTTIEKGVSDLLDNEAKRVVSSMPNWTPGKHNDKLVSVKMVLPIKFQL